MQLYDKPVWQLMYDLVQDLGLQKGQLLPKPQVLAWFGRRYPKIRAGTISAHLTKLSTNAPSRIHYGCKPGRDDLFFYLGGSRYRLYDPESDPPPIHGRPQPPAPGRHSQRKGNPPSFLAGVADQLLKDRLSRLASAPLDTVIREAGVVLEDRLRRAGAAGSALFGGELVDAVLAPGTGSLVFSADPREQDGVRLLFRGAMQFIRNPPMHKLIEYRGNTARQMVRLVDSLLQLLAEGEGRKQGAAPVGRGG